jgi:hypothetical protein
MKAISSLRLILGTVALVVSALPALARDRWTEAQAKAWQDRVPWLAGCNFLPSTASNQLEMWQEDTFDPATIDRELGWAAGLGFTSLRVFLHDLPWREDRPGFLRRLERFLAIADRHQIGVMFVVLDGCWDPRPRSGPQRAPRPHVHNSGWVQSPGAAILGDPSRHGEVRDYVYGVIRHFRSDQRIHAWDLFNEPENDNRNSYGVNGANIELRDKAEMAFRLLEQAFRWAQLADPTQPLTAGLWMGPWPDDTKLSAIEKLMVEQSDVLSFHNYGPLEQVRLRVEQLRRYGRPILCTEYMSRPVASTFDPILGYLKEQRVGAFNWGFVAGKSQTIYPWDSWQKTYTAEPPVWFHDILRPDGTPFDAKEADYIKGVTGKR